MTISCFFWGHKEVFTALALSVLIGVVMKHLRSLDLDFKDWVLVAAISISGVISLISLLAVLSMRRRLRIVEAGHPTSRPCKIILVRHGESEGNIDEKVYRTVPDSEVSLTEKGKRQAVEAGRRLAEIIDGRRVFVYVSPYMRTKQTAECIMQSISSDQIVQQREDPRIREQEFAGTFQDENPSRKERENYSRFFFRFKGGESGADVFDRVSLFMDTLYRDFRLPSCDNDSVVLIVSHGLTCRLFLMRWLHWTVETFNLASNPPNAAIMVLERQAPDERGKSFYRLTPETTRLLGISDDLGESVPSAWPKELPRTSSKKDEIGICPSVRPTALAADKRSFSSPN